jgi:hypothetical protein
MFDERRRKFAATESGVTESLALKTSNATPPERLIAAAWRGNLHLEQPGGGGSVPTRTQFTPLDQYFMKDPLTFPQIPPQSANCSPSSARVQIRGGKRSSRRLHLHANDHGRLSSHEFCRHSARLRLMPPTLARSAWRRSPPQRPAVHRSQSASARAPNRPGVRSETPGSASRLSRAQCRRW